MNLPKNIGKSTLLAMSIFWTINFTKDFDWDFMPFVILSAIPIGLCVAVVITATICPLFWVFKKKNESNLVFSKKHFPYYNILAFCLCLLGVFTSDFDFYFISFFITAYLTTAQSWVWFAKEKNA